jgi:hypothetical protein
MYRHRCRATVMGRQDQACQHELVVDLDLANWHHRGDMALSSARTFSEVLELSSSFALYIIRYQQRYEKADGLLICIALARQV